MNGPAPAHPDPHRPIEQGGAHLGAPDQAALDALVDANFEVTRVPEHLRARAQAAAWLLAHLRPGATAIQGRDERIADAMARVREAATPQAALCPADEDALEALISSGYDARRVAGGMRQRAAQHLALLQLLDASGAASDAPGAPYQFAREALVRRTADAIARTPAPAVSDLTAAGGRRRAFRLADLVSIAALLLIGTAIVWPVTASMRESARQASCQGNLAGLGGAFGSYAANNRDALPMATASLAGTPWWYVGDPARSNSANVFQLRREKYTTHDVMTCAGNRWAVYSLPEGARDWPQLANVSYSYQNMFAHQRPTYAQSPRLVVLVDRSPVVLRAVRGQLIDPEENSPNHGGRGQSMLRLDGSAPWTTSPVLDDTGDNVWLPRDLERAIQEWRAKNGRKEADPLKGVESPAARDDVFVGP